MKVIDAKDFEKLSPLFRGKRGSRYAEFIIHLLAIDKINNVYDRSGKYTGARFTSGLLNDLGVNYMIGNADRLNDLPGGAFITVSNHPYGGLDGIILVDLMASVRSDYKLMVNKILALVKTMKDNFISVTPAGNKKPSLTSTTIAGIRETLTHLRDGHPVGFFPSGAVSDFSLRDMCVRDREWQKSVLSLVRSARVPILPIRFFDKNSPLFYFLGVINWRIRLLRMPREVFNKKNKPARIAIGKIIPVKEQEKFADAVELGKFLRKTVYEMPEPDSFIPRSVLSFTGEPTEKDKNLQK